VKTIDLRGNVPTRIRKLKEGLYDAILLANAGVKRLGLDLSDFHCELLNPAWFVPAPAQGVVAIQTRESDSELNAALKKIGNAQSEKTSWLERKVLNMLDGGCQLPLGVHCEYADGTYRLRAARAETWDASPVRVNMEGNQPEILAVETVERLLKRRSGKVFVSRDTNAENSYLHRVLQNNGYEVIGESLIEINPVPFNVFPDVEWIFFSSPNSVRYFFNRSPFIHPKVRFAAMGSGTAAALRQVGRTADFTGDSPDVSETAFAFGEVAYGSSILFPKALHSLRTIQKCLPENTKAIDLDVYETVPKLQFDIPECHVAVLTSPLNAEAYLKKYPERKNCVFVAMGKSTGKKLEEFGIASYHMPARLDEAGLAEAVFTNA
jgi:uroporphyrinogen-III synthase